MTWETGRKDAAKAEEERSTEEPRGREEAEASAEGLKHELLVNMSHELRTPLNGIVGMVELLLQEDLSETSRVYVEVIRDASADLGRVVDDLLDFSRATSGKLKLEAVDFDFAAAVEGAVDLLRARAQVKGIALRVEIAEPLAGWFRGDPARLRQVLLNLAGNAIKFTEAGQVDVEAVAEDLPGGEPRIRVNVRDTGIGIAPEDRERLFEPFVQADGSAARRFGGAGLGLAISRQIVEEMGGEIGVESTLDSGSLFWFTLPRVAGQAAGDTEALGPEAAQLGRILVVEDDETSQLVVRFQLERLGYRADVVTNGHEALEALSRRDYDLVLMDCQMPHLDGYEATRRLRQREAAAGLPPVPVIALTAYALTGDREKCLAAGMDDYLSKPVEEERLDAAIKRWIGPRLS